MIKPHLTIRLGDPAGIGCEIVERTVNSTTIKRVCSPVVFGDIFFSSNFKNTEFIPSSNAGSLLKTGYPSTKAGVIAISAIYEAVKYCMNGIYIGFQILLQHSPSFKRITENGRSKIPRAYRELLASLTKSRKVAMMMACKNIHGVMVTRHIPVEKI
jgi:4-hydroxythreonine-4-phosphate dehydrogenase